MEYGDVLTGRIVKYPTIRLFYCQEKEIERHVMQTQDVAEMLNVAETTVRQWTLVIQSKEKPYERMQI